MDRLPLLLNYYLSLAWRDLVRQPWYGLLMAVILGFGVGIFMTTYSLLHVLSGDPIPHKSNRLLSVRMGVVGEDDVPPRQMPELAIRSIRQSLAGIQVVSMTYGYAGVEGVDTGERQTRKAGILRFTEGPFFEVFDVPVSRGRVWSADEDAQGAPVALIGAQLARELFGTEDVVGRSVHLGGANFRILGTIGAWRPAPRYYDLSVGAYAPADDLYLPKRSLRYMSQPIFVTRACPFNEANPDVRELEQSRCSWLTSWALVGSAGERATLEARLDDLASRGVREGWLEPRSVAKVESVREMLQRMRVVPGGVRYGVFVAASFLLLCLVNASGLLLAKYLRRTQEIGVRRALGASRTDIVAQFVVDALLMGGLSSVFGVIFTMAGIKLIQLLPKGYLQLAAFDVWVLLLALAVSVFVGVLAGLFPAWRASGVEPAIQVKVD